MTRRAPTSRDAITEHLFPAWKGTPWAFYGATNVPGEGAIACGYWVANILLDVGFRIDRDHVGKQASANHAGFVWIDGTQVYFCHSN